MSYPGANLKERNTIREAGILLLIVAVIALFAFRIVEEKEAAPLSHSSSSSSSLDIENEKRFPSQPVLETSATINIEGVLHKMTPNSIHEYPRWTVPSEATIPVHLAVRPNDFVEVTALDGGVLDNKTISQSQMAGPDGSVDFHFRVMANPGEYRVAVERNGERSILNFWVGPDLPGRVQEQTN